MRNKIFMGLGLALSMASAVAAQQPADSAHGHHGKGERGERGGHFEGRRGPGGPFGAQGLLLKDITLTDAQKTQLKQLRETQRQKMDANRDAMRQQFEQARAAREKGDTATARAIMQKNRQAMDAERDQHIAAIRNILTAEQRVQFDKNVAELKQREAKREANGREGFGRGGRRGGPDGFRGKSGKTG